MTRVEAILLGVMIIGISIILVVAEGCDQPTTTKSTISVDPAECSSEQGPSLEVLALGDSQIALVPTCTGYVILISATDQYYWNRQAQFVRARLDKVLNALDRDGLTVTELSSIYMREYRVAVELVVVKQQ